MKSRIEEFPHFHIHHFHIIHSTFIKLRIMSSTVDRIRLFNQNRDPEKLQLKYAAMRTGAFRFFRGSCHLFYEDLFHAAPLPESPAAWICGDLHIENFGSFKGSDRVVYFDINDFDEAVLGPALWEIVRLLTSVAVASVTLQYSKTHINDLYASLLDGYTFRLRQGKPMTIETATAGGLIQQLLEKVCERKGKNLIKERADIRTAYATLLTDNKRAFPVPDREKSKIIRDVGNWLSKEKKETKWKAEDTVYRIAGTGSIGIKRNLVLVQNKTTLKRYLLDIKQALPSSLLPYIHTPQPPWQNEAERIIHVQNRMQHVCPGWLNEMNIGNDWFVIKEIQPISDKVNFSGFERLFADQLTMVFTLGELAASAQLRSNGRQGSATTDELIRFAEHESWRPVIIAYANNYTRQVKNDYLEFCKAFDKGYFQ